MKKAAGPDTAFYLKQIPNVGREIAIDLKCIGLTKLQDLIQSYPFRKTFLIVDVTNYREVVQFISESSI